MFALRKIVGHAARGLTSDGFSNYQGAFVSHTKRLSGGLQFDTSFRVDAFDVFNHANFASPGNIVGSPTFGKITSTRLPTGEAGSSRQIQLAVRILH
jgi:hypothetical protein